MEVFFLYNFNSKMIVLSGIFIALIIIFTHVLAIQTLFLRISFGFLPLAVYASICGPLYGAFIGALADILGCLIFSPGFYFPGFTISTALSGYIYGYYFHDKPVSLKRICIVFIFLFCSVDMLLNTFWLSLLYHKAATAFLLSRFIKNIIFLPINIIVFSVVYKTIQKYLQKNFVILNKKS